MKPFTLLFLLCICMAGCSQHEHAERNKMIEDSLRSHIIPEIRWYSMRTRNALSLFKETIETIILPDGSSAEVVIPSLENTPFRDQSVKINAYDVSLYDAMMILARLPNIDFAITNGIVIFINTGVQQDN